MSMEIVYVILLLVFLYGTTRFAMKLKGGYGLIIPLIMVVVSGWFLFQEKLPETNERLIVLGMVFLFMVGFSKKKKSKEERKKKK